MAPAQYKFLDLSGYAFTGKHAVIDLVREFRGYNVPHFQFEFCLLRIQGGILDLKTALLDDWSPVRADAAVRRFKRLVRRIGKGNSWLEPGTWLSSVGLGYEEYFNHRFLALSERYVKDLVIYSWKAEWPFAAADWSDMDLLWRKFKRKLKIKDAYAVEMCLPDPEAFLPATERYLSDLLSSNVREGTQTIVMHNAFEPFNPVRSLDLFRSAKCIIVDRDPRDNYVAGLWYKPTALPPRGFIERYRLYRQVTERNWVDSPNVLLIKYENLLIHYDETVRRILEFLGEEKTVHVEPRHYFDPAVSIKNIGIWKSHPRQEEISLIRHELRDYCHPEVD